MEDYVEEGVLDQSTLKTLYELSNRGTFSALGGVLNTGKEADVFHALEDDDDEIAIKVYRTATNRFKEMREHLRSDPRIDSIGGSRRDIIYRWTRREYGNLKKAAEVVRVPDPIDIEKNVIAMEFVGEDGVRAPTLRRMEFDDWDHVADLLVDMYKRLYEEDLIHGDFSEYNVMVMGELVLIDFGQAVTPDHPMADEYLRRDVKNLVNFLNRKGVDMDAERVMDTVTGAS